MRRTVSNLIVIGVQLLIVGLFFGTVFNDDVRLERHVNIVHNENLNKIAESVSLLFKDEDITSLAMLENNIDDFIIEDLPSIDTIKEEEIIEKEKDVTKSTPLVSVDASKYSSNEPMGFLVTEGNRTYNLSNYEFDVVVAVVAGEFDKNLNDALAVVSVILNRCDSDTWRNWAGDSPYQQVTRAGQFEVYFAGMYLKYMPNGSQYGTEKYNIAKQAVIDGLNGIRNNKYLGFRAWWLSGYSDKYIVHGGNRYAYN